MRKPLEACPCCGYLTLCERGDYEICAVCFWEDNGLDDAEKYSGPNYQTLGEAQTNFRDFGACDRASISHVVPGVDFVHKDDVAP